MPVSLPILSATLGLTKLGKISFVVASTNQTDDYFSGSLGPSYLLIEYALIAVEKKKGFQSRDPEYSQE